MSLDILAAAFGVAFLAAACQSLTAFGFALVMVPLLSLAWEAKPAVVTSTFVGTPPLILLLYEVRSSVEASRVAPMLLGSFLGIAPGVLLLDRIDPAALKVLVASVVIVAALSLFFSPHIRLRQQQHLLLSQPDGLPQRRSEGIDQHGRPARGPLRHLL